MPIALGRVYAHADHAACEAIVAHRRHRDQHLPVEIAALRAAPLLPRAARRPRSCRSARACRSSSGEEPCSHPAPVLRVNFMSKCYLIGWRLQTTRRLVPCILRATIFVSQFGDDAAQAMICVGSIHLSRHRSASGSAPAHDEFSGGRKVSAIHRASMITRHRGAQPAAAERRASYHRLLRDRPDRAGEAVAAEGAHAGTATRAAPCA